LLCDHPPERRTFEQLRRIVNSSPSEFPELAKAMAESANQDVRHAAATLILPAVETLGGYLSHAQEQLEFARGPLVQAATRRSTFSLDAVTSGEPLSIYIVMPPDKLESHGRLLRLWIGVLMSAIIRRRAQPRQSTLLLLDEAAQLGTMPQLRQAISLLRGYGVQTWSFWQDISQLKQLYPGDWETMVNNCKIQQAFGANNLRASRDVAELMGFSDPYKIQDLEHDEMALLISGDEPVIALRPSYLNDSIFAGHFDRNPLYDAGRPIMPPHMPAPEPVPPPLAQAPASKQYTRPPKAQPAVGGSRLAKIPSVDKDALADLKGLWG
jgi:type IV secretion system protein VirD4